MIFVAPCWLIHTVAYYMLPVLAPLALALRLPPPLLSVTDPQLAAVHSFSRTASWLVPQLVL